MHIFGNITGTSKFLREYVKDNFNLVEVINSIINSSSVFPIFPIALSKNFVWVARNFTLDAKDLSLAEITGIVNIFSEYIEPFSKSEFMDEVAI